MITVSGKRESLHGGIVNTRANRRILRQNRRTAWALGLVLLVLLQLDSQVQFHTVAATPQDRTSSSSSSSSSSTSSSTQSTAAQSSTSTTSSSSASLIDGIILDEEGALLTGGQPALSEEAAIHLFFHPPQLNFAERSIGDPHNQPVVLFNRHKNRSVYLGSISGSTAEFSSSYFKEKMIPPGGNTTFSVVFLPRKLGSSDGSLLVHTSFGMVRYPVRGEGIECPYRLRPLVGLQAPLNATLSPEITLYNPHDTPLQIVEVRSSGGLFQLELPGGGQEGPHTLWEVPPHSTRTVIRVQFHARTPGHHIAYVRIKISGGPANPALAEKMLVVPIEVDTAKETGLYSRIPFLELGVTSSLSEVASSGASRHAMAASAALAVPVDDSEFGLSVQNGCNVTRLSLDLHNSGSQLVRVKSWGVQADDIESVLCMHVLVLEGPTLHVEFDWSKLTSDRRHISGRILLNLERVISPSDGGGEPGMNGDEEEEDGEQQEDGSRNEDDTMAAVRATTYDADDAGAADGTGRTAKIVTSIYSIPFAGEVLKGSIQYNEEVLRFLLPSAHEREEEGEGTTSSQGRPLVIRNHFNVPLSITNISVPENCSRYFAIEGFRPIVLQPNDERTLLRISRKVDATGGLLQQPFTIATSIRLATNISDYELPVLGYSGRLERLLSPTVRDASLLTPTGLVQPVKGGTGATDTDNEQQQQQELDFGVLPIATIGEALVAFRNPNPVPIPIIHWKGAITSEAAVGAPTITVILRGCGPLRLDGLVFCHTVQPGEWIVYQISVQSGTIDSYQGRFTVKTDYEEIVTPLRFTTAVGELHLMRERLRFDDCFPGKLCSLSLLAASSFPTKIQIESIRTDVPGLSYEFLSPEKQRPLAPNQPVVLYPDTVTSIGRMTLDPKAHCGPSDCYSSFDLLSKPFGVKWMATLDCYEQYRRLDSDKLLQQLQRYAEMRQRLTSVHFQVLAESSRRFAFNASVDLVWPKLLDENVFFPTLQVEQEAVRLITINNPSDQILFVHLVLHDVATHGRQPIVDAGGDSGSSGSNGGINLPPEVLTACGNCTLSEESVFSFFLFDSDDIYVNYVKPQSFLRIAVKFSARLPGTYSTVLYMRNNLTLIDAAWIQARAVVPLFKLGNRRPGSPTALQFEITEKHVRPCYDQWYRKLRSEGRYKKYMVDGNGQQFEIKEQDDLQQTTTSGVGAVGAGVEAKQEEFVVETRRTFTARNYGEVPIHISGIRIEDAPCEGFGFKVLDCAPFELAPNASRKIEIAFAPDFTLSRVTRVLHFDTNINNFPVNFTLLGTVPMQRLEVCNWSLPRPWFEYWLRTVLIIVLPTALFGTLVTALLEANRLLRVNFLSHVRERGPLQPPLDLRQIGLQHMTSSEGGGGGGGEGSSGSVTSSSSKESNGGGGKEGKANGSTNQNSGSNVFGSSSSNAISRSNRKQPDRKNGAHAKIAGGGGGSGGGLQNGGATTAAALGDIGTASRYNRSWTEYSLKLGVSAGTTGSSSPSDGSKSAQSSSSSSSSSMKSRRSVTPSKDQHQPVVGSDHPPCNAGVTKDRTKSPSSACETENKTSKNKLPGVKAIAVAAAAPSSSTTSDLTGVLESNSTASSSSSSSSNSKQHHHSNSSSTSSSTSSSSEELAPRHSSSTVSASLSSTSASSSSSSSASTSSSSSSSPSPTSKQQQQQHNQSKQQQSAATKSNVKKTKSLPVRYESVVVSLATVFAATSTLSRATATTSTTTAAFNTSQNPSTEVTATTSVTATPITSSSSMTPSTVMKETAKDNSKVRSSAGNGGKQHLVSSSNGTGTTKVSNKQQQESSNVKTGSEKNNSSAGESLGKENSSSNGNNIISGHDKVSSSGNGNAQHQVDSSLNQNQHHHQPAQHQQQQSISSSSSSKKFSKTPGRERKPNQSKKGSGGGGTNGKGTSSGSQQYKGTALQFNNTSTQQHKSTTIGTILQNASVPMPSSSSGAVWGENCARFSDVVAQTSTVTSLSGKLSGGAQSSISSIMPSMEDFFMFSGLSLGGGTNGQNTEKSVNQQRSQGSNNNAYGGVATPSSTGGSSSTAQRYRKQPLHSLQDIPSATATSTTSLSGSSSSNGTKANAANRVEQKSKDDSYLGGTHEKECSTQFVVTSGSPDLGPIGTSKKSPSGANSADGDGEEADSLMEHVLGGGRIRSSIGKCWEPFGGHLIHNPAQLAGGSTNDPATSSIGKSMNGGGQQSDSFFSQSFADIHHRQNDPYRGIASMAGAGSNGGLNGIGTSSLLSNAGHPYTDHTIGDMSNGGTNQLSSMENDFMELHYRSRHQQQQQQQVGRCLRTNR
uniref:TMEM131_like domain-containing protein n=1 Tax=Anopheles epiroticus TaxID=199890 RepID=A0A182PMP0_9DIPT